MAVKIVRQPNKIALIGVPSSAAGFALGTEKAPAALRAAGLIEKLQFVGFEVSDLGDCAPHLFADDDEHKRARNLPEIVASLNDLKPRAELAVKSGALVLVVGGDCAECVALLAGARRYYKHINLLWLDRHADLNTPASTPSGRLDGMVLAGIVGKGSPELVRFWGEPPLVREPDALLYGLEALDPAEQEFLARSPMRALSASDVRARGAEAAAQQALGLLHAESREFMIHVDLDVINQEEFSFTSVPGSGGLSFAELQSSLGTFLSSKNLLALDVAQYNPGRDPDGSGARKVVDLLVATLSVRFGALVGPRATDLDSTASSAPPDTGPAEVPAAVAPEAAPSLAVEPPGEPVPGGPDVPGGTDGSDPLPS